MYRLSTYARTHAYIFVCQLPAGYQRDAMGVCYYGHTLRGVNGVVDESRLSRTSYTQEPRPKYK